MCIAFISKANAQVALSGKITDDENLPVIGATVYVESVGSGVVTDLDGNYAISFAIPEGATIEYKFMGMKTQTLKYNPNRTTHNVTLTYDSEVMDEIVIVGYGEQRKETVVGSITSATNEDIMRAGNVTTISEALTGILPGVSTMQASGQPGDSAADILIRGQSSWTNNTPLYMVDGIERSFNDIDPNEIASISVLKDASATAVYGVKAANGVILVTTKTGGVSKPRITFSATTTLKTPTVDTEYVSDFPTTLEYFNVAARNDDRYDLLKTDREINTWRDPNRNMEKYTYTNWQEYMLGNGVSQMYNINVSGGTKNVKYFTSMGYQNDGDIFEINEKEDYDPRTNQKRYNYRSNVDIQATKTTKVSVKLAGDIINFNGNPATKNGGASNDNNALQLMYSRVMIGTAPILNNGAYGMEETETKNSKNMLATIEGAGSYHKRSNRFFSDLSIEQDLYKDELKLTGKIAYDQFRSYDYNIEQTNPLMMWPANDKGVYEDVFGGIDLPKINKENINAYNKSFYYEAALRYKKTFNEIHNVSALALMTRREYQNKVDWINKEESWIGRVTYDYNRKYLVEFNGAYNGSEKFSPDERFGFFPSAAVGWVLTEENFMKKTLPAIEFMKVRYSYGIVGSDAAAPRFAYISPYETIDINRYFGSNPSYDISKNSGGYYRETAPANVYASWETAVKQNLGFELVFLKGRLKTTFDLFDEQREDIYMNYRSIPTWYGGSVPGANMGKTKNHGFDLELTWNDKIGDFRYWAKGSLSMSENRVVFRDDPINTPEYQKLAGKPIGGTTGLLYTGMYGSWQDIYLYPQSSFNSDALVPGDLIYNDYNSDGEITDLDKVVIGSPSYAAKTFAFSLGATWKGFSVSAMFNGMFDISKKLADSDLWCSASTGLSSIGFLMHNNSKTDAWSPENINASHPTLHYAQQKQPQTIPSTC